MHSPKAGAVKHDELSAVSIDRQRALLAELLRQRAATTEQFPMSAGQQGLWHAYRRNPELTPFNAFLPARIRGLLRPQAMRQAIELVAQRHAALRTTFSDRDGQPRQIVHRHLPPEFACTPMLGADLETVRERARQETLRPFDLERGPLLRIHLYQLAEDDWVVLATAHHIIVDFWSLILILGELRQSYPQIVAGHPPDLLPAIDNYRQFVDEQSRLLAGPSGQPLAQYWQQVLAEGSPVLELPIDRQRPAAFSHRAECVPIEPSQELSRRVARLASRLRTTSFSVVHAALQVLLGRYSRQSSFFIGSPFSGRSHHKYEQTVGFFINMLPVRADLRPELTFADLVRQTSRRLVDSIEHEAFPIAEIVRQSGLPRDPSRSPLFQVSCTFDKAHKQAEAGRAGFLIPSPTKAFEFGELRQESFYIPHPTCHYDLEFIFDQSPDGLQGMLIYCRDLFRRQSMEQMARNYVALLDSLLEQSTSPLGEVPWQTPAPSPCPLPRSGGEGTEMDPNPGLLHGEGRGIGPGPVMDGSEDARPTLAGSKATSMGSPSAPGGGATRDAIPGSSDRSTAKDDTRSANPTTVPAMIQQAARAHPDGLALQSQNQALTYRHLLLAAGGLSRQLQQRGIQPDQLVPVLCRDGATALVAMLAVHQAGGAAVPIDLAQPSNQLERILSRPPRPGCFDSPDRLAGHLTAGSACRLPGRGSYRLRNPPPR